MKTRLLASGLVLLAAVLAACGGGGGTSSGGGITPSGPTPTPVPTSTPGPTPTPTNNPFGCPGQPPFTNGSVRRTFAGGSRPVNPGDAFDFSGQLQETRTQSAPCPEPTSTTSASVTMSVNDSAANPAPTAGAVDSQSVETEAFPQYAQTTTTDSILWEGPSQVQLYSTKASDGNGDTMTTSYAQAQLIDQLPETASSAWGPNDPAATIDEALVDGTRIVRNVDSNGGYVDTENDPNGAVSTITANPDGSGDYNLGGVLTDIAYAAPANNSIVITITDNSVSPAVSKTRTIPAWFTLSTPLINDAFADNGTFTGTLPCTVPPSVTFTTPVTQVVETASTLDPVVGYTEKRVTTWYDSSNIGPLCVTVSDTVNSYYDYSNDVFRIDQQSDNGQPLKTDTITETLGIQAQPTVMSVRRAPENSRGVSPAYFAARVAAIDARRGFERAQRIEALHRFVSAMARKAGGR